MTQIGIDTHCHVPPAAGNWPLWAVPQLEQAVALAGEIRSLRGNAPLATELYREWFTPVLPDAGRLALRRPAVGLYRAAHAGSGTRLRSEDLWVLDRHDVVGRDGWWRTWNRAWVPTRSRAGAVRVLLSPRPDADGLTGFVAAVTKRMRAEPTPWLLACATDPRRLRRRAAAVLYLPAGTAVPDGLLDAVRPTLVDSTPPLCLRLAEGAALAEYPSNGMSFGEHRCHLLALGLRTRAARRAPLRVIAEVFAEHGVDPASPYCSTPVRLGQLDFGGLRG